MAQTLEEKIGIRETKDSLNQQLNTFTVKKIDTCIKSFQDQKKEKNNLSKGSQKNLDYLIERYSKKRDQILKVYYKNRSKDCLQGLDKSLLSVNKLSLLLNKDLDHDRQVVKGFGIAGKIGLGLLGAGSVASILGEQLSKVDWAAFSQTSFAKFFTETVKTWLQNNWITAMGIGGLGVTAAAAGIWMKVNAVKKANAQKRAMQYEAEKKMDAGVKSKEIMNFGAANFSSNKNAILAEVMDDKDLQEFLKKTLNNPSSSITPIMRSNINQILSLVQMKEHTASIETEKTIFKNHVFSNSNDAEIKKYMEEKEKVKELEEIERLKSVASGTISDPNFATLLAGTGFSSAHVSAINNAYMVGKGSVDTAILTKKENATISDISYSVTLAGPGTTAAKQSSAETIVKNAVESYFNKKKEQITSERSAQEKLDAYNAKHGTSCTLASISTEKATAIASRDSVRGSIETTLSALPSKNAGESNEAYLSRLEKLTGLTGSGVDTTTKLTDLNTKYTNHVKTNLTDELLEETLKEKESAGRAKS